MNFLAHALLSPPTPPGLLIGNLTADWIKGRARQTLPQEIQQGFALHRAIDAFTDAHPAVIACSRLLSDRWGRYAPVLVDILLDHCLASDWQTHSPNHPLPDFAQHVYQSLHPHRDHFPTRVREGIDHMTHHDWLTSYAHLDGVRIALARLSLRLKHGVNLAPATEDFTQHEPHFRQTFHQFFPALKHHTQSVCTTLHPTPT